MRGGELPFLLLSYLLEFLIFVHEFERRRGKPEFKISAIVDDTTYPVFAVMVLLSGFGGGKFASSWSNSSFFFTKKTQAMHWSGMSVLEILVLQSVKKQILLLSALHFLCCWEHQLSHELHL